MPQRRTRVAIVDLTSVSALCSQDALRAERPFSAHSAFEQQCYTSSHQPHSMSDGPTCRTEGIAILMLKLLLVGRMDAVLRTQSAVLKGKAHQITLAVSEEELQNHLQQGDFDIAVLNHTLHRSERRRYSAAIKAHDPRKLVLVLHASGARDNPNADIAVDSRLGPEAILRSLEILHLMSWVSNHEHEELAGEFVVVVDQDRHYLFVSDAVCNLIGFHRGELIGRQIEEIAHGNKSVDVEKQFEDFKRTGYMDGEFVLRHRSGKPVPIHYSARVQPDGCLIAKWTPNISGNR